MMAAATATVFYPLRPPASIGALSSSARLKQPTSSGGYRGNDAGLVTVAVFSRRTAIIFVTSTLSSIIAPPFISATQAEEMDDEDEESMATRVFEETSSSVVAIKDVEILQPGNAGDQIRLVNDETIRIEGTGSGFFWDEAGHIVTNYHVIAKLATDMSGRQKCKVLLLDADNNTIVKEGRLVGFDAAYDLAVLKVDVEDGKLKPALLGTSQDLLVGQSCFAIGNPYGYEHTLTAGETKIVPSVEGKSKTENIPVQVTAIVLIKDNYLTWSATITIGITSRGKYEYIAGLMKPPTKTNPTWGIWFLEDNHVKM